MMIESSVIRREHLLLSVENISRLIFHNKIGLNNTFNTSENERSKEQLCFTSITIFAIALPIFLLPSKAAALSSLEKRCQIYSVSSFLAKDQILTSNNRVLSSAHQWLYRAYHLTSIMHHPRRLPWYGNAKKALGCKWLL